MLEKFHACVIIYPAPGKEARLKELLKELTTRVKEDEPGARFEFFEHLNPDTGRNLYVLQEIWENKAALDAYFATSAFITIVIEKFPNEGLFA